MLEPHYSGAAPPPRPRHPILAVLDNVRSAFNVGSMFRTADAVGVQEMLLCGLTAWPPHPKIEKTSLGAHSYVPWSRYETTEQALDRLRAEGIPIVAVEVTERSVAMGDFAWPAPVALVFGHEIVGVSDEALSRADAVVKIPMYGQKNSINVATAFGIVMYEVLRATRIG